MCRATLYARSSLRNLAWRCLGIKRSMRILQPLRVNIGVPAAMEKLWMRSTRKSARRGVAATWPNHHAEEADGRGGCCHDTVVRPVWAPCLRQNCYGSVCLCLFVCMSVCMTLFMRSYRCVHVRKSFPPCPAISPEPRLPTALPLHSDPARNSTLPSRGAPGRRRANKLCKDISAGGAGGTRSRKPARSERKLRGVFPASWGPSEVWLRNGRRHCTHLVIVLLLHWYCTLSCTNTGAALVLH